MDETPLIQQYLQLRSEFMGYLYAITRDAELAEEVYQNAAVVVIEKANTPEMIRNFRAWAKEVVRRQALHAIRAREVAARHGRAVSPDLLEAVSHAFIHDTSEDSVIRTEHHVRATLRSDRRNAPERIDFWADVDSGVALRAEVRWPDARQMRFELIESMKLPNQWYHHSQHVPGREVVRLDAAETQ